MAKDSKIRMPSGQGGLVSYYDQSSSKILFSPQAVVILTIVIIVLIIALHAFGGLLFA